MAVVLDDIDLRILQLMQENARLSNVDMAKQLEMAPSAVLERVKKLENKKIIRQYNASIDPAAVEQKLLAFVFLRVDGGMDSTPTGAALAQIPEVQEVHIVAGEDCYLVKVRTTDSAALIALSSASRSAFAVALIGAVVLVVSGCGETVIDDQKTEITRSDVARQQAVGADQDVDLAVGKPLHRLTLLGLRAEA